MPRHYSRTARVGDLIQTELAKIIQLDLQATPMKMITITGVEVSPDFSHAKVFVSTLEDNPEKIKQDIDALNHASKNYRYELAHAVKMRITPELKFFFDDSTVRGSRITSLIENALKDASHTKNPKE